jgi:hypothetical protein
MISITVSSLEKLYVQYTGMPSSIYQCVINVGVSLAIRGSPGISMNISVQEHDALNNQIL